jgi:hypothetical protein
VKGRRNHSVRAPIKWNEPPGTPAVEVNLILQRKIIDAELKYLEESKGLAARHLRRQGNADRRRDREPFTVKK